MPYEMFLLFVVHIIYNSQRDKHLGMRIYTQVPVPLTIAVPLTIVMRLGWHNSAK